MTNCHRIQVKVVPKSRRDEIVSWDGEYLKIKVTAVPEKGEANVAVIALLSELFHLPKKHIVLVSGAASRSKWFLIEEISREKFDTILSQFRNIS